LEAPNGGSLKQSIAMEEIDVPSNGIRLHVVLAGDPAGQPVVLLHGFPEFWYGWRHQIPALSQAGFRLILPDQRGYNLSEKPMGVGSYALADLVKDVLGLIDHFGYRQVDLVGHDWGAAVAWQTATVFPERIRRLVIMNVPHPAVMATYLAKSPAQVLRSWYIAFFQVPGLADRLLRMQNYAVLGHLLVGSGKAETFSADDLVEYRKAWSQPGSLTAMINWYRAIARHRPAFAVDPRIHLPTLMIWGKRDVALGFAMVRPSFELCDQCRLRIFDEATHWVQHDASDQVNQVLIEFLQSPNPSGSVWTV
jgi:pimeloyl-ACP methyl ester carboxylesterase